MAAAGMAALLALSGCTHEDAPRSFHATSTPLAMSRVDPAATTRGNLRFLGAVRVESDDDDFGGLSDLLVSDDGTRFVAVSDEAHWVTGTLEHDSAGRLVAVHGGRIAPMLDAAGTALSGKAADAEGLAADALGRDPLDGDLFVSFEGAHRVWRYAFGQGGAQALPSDVALPDAARMASVNGGLEGLELMAPGRLLAVSEHDENPSGDYRAWILGAAAGEAALELAVKPAPPFSLTAVRILEGGDVLTLERSFNPVRGLGVQMRRIATADLAAAVAAASAGEIPKPLDGPVLARFDRSDEIDNFEGVSVRRTADGRTLLYLVSDDNFNEPLQSTIFALYELMP
jgi:hypothetical protein